MGRKHLLDVKLGMLLLLYKCTKRVRGFLKWRSFDGFSSLPCGSVVPAVAPAQQVPIGQPGTGGGVGIEYHSTITSARVH